MVIGWYIIVLTTFKKSWSTKQSTAVPSPEPSREPSPPNAHPAETAFVDGVDWWLGGGKW